MQLGRLTEIIIIIIYWNTDKIIFIIITVTGSTRSTNLHQESSIYVQYCILYAFVLFSLFFLKVI